MNIHSQTKKKEYERLVHPKACSVCKQVKDDSQYYANRRCKDGRSPHCIVCQAVKDKEPKNIFSRLKGKIWKEEGVEWTLTYEQWRELIQKPCHYCGHTYKQTAGRGLDQKIPKGGYHIDNVVPACATCNSIKGCHFSLDEMLRMGKVIGDIKATRKALGLPMPENATPMSPRGIPRPWGKWTKRKFKGEQN